MLTHKITLPRHAQKTLQTFTGLSEVLLDIKHIPQPLCTEHSLWLISQKGKIRQEKEINLTVRACTPRSVCGNKKVVELQCQGMPWRWGWAAFQTRHWAWLGFVDLFTHLLFPCSQGLSHSLFLSAEKKKKKQNKKLGKQVMRKEELGRTVRKKYTTAAQPCITSAAPYLLFLVKMQHPSLPSWYHSQISNFDNLSPLNL